MNPPRRPSTRFQPTGWTEKLVPLLLVLLTVVLFGTLLFLFLVLAGLLP